MFDITAASGLPTGTCTPAGKQGNTKTTEKQSYFFFFSLFFFNSEMKLKKTDCKNTKKDDKAKFTRTCDEDHKCSTARQMH